VRPTRVADLGLSILSRSRLAAVLNVTATIVRLLEVQLGVVTTPVGPSLTYSLDDAIRIETALARLDPHGLLQRHPTGRRGRPPRDHKAAG
jgi:hypothetical protein